MLGVSPTSLSVLHQPPTQADPLELEGGFGCPRVQVVKQVRKRGRKCLFARKKTSSAAPSAPPAPAPAAGPAIVLVDGQLTDFHIYLLKVYHTQGGTSCQNKGNM